MQAPCDFCPFYGGIFPQTQAFRVRFQPKGATCMGKLKFKPWISNGRADETIGGGFIVFRRGSGTKRIRPSYWPFEHADEGSAMAQAKTLAELNPGQTFEVFGSLGSVAVPAPTEAVKETA